MGETNNYGRLTREKFRYTTHPSWSVEHRQPNHILHLYNYESINKNNGNEKFANRTQWQRQTYNHSRCQTKADIKRSIEILIYQLLL